MRPGRRALAKWVAGIAVFGLVYGVALLQLRRFGLGELAAEAVERAGLWGALLFIVVMAAAVMSPLPDAPVALAGLIAYGPAGGILLVVSGSWLGAAADFWLVRLLGRERFRRRFPHLAAPIDDLAGLLGFELLVVLRFLPTVSFDIVSYTAAVTHVPFFQFGIATLLGQLPGPIIAASVGVGVGGSGRIMSVSFGIVALALLVMLLYARRALRRPPPAGGPPPHP